MFQFIQCRNIQEQVKKAFFYQKLFWPFTVQTNCSSDLKFFTNSRPSTLNFKIYSRSLEQLFLTVGQNNFGNFRYRDLSLKFLKKRVDMGVWFLLNNLIGTHFFWFELHWFPKTLSKKAQIRLSKLHPTKLNSFCY